MSRTRLSADAPRAAVVSFAIEPVVREQIEALAREKHLRISSMLREIVLEALKQRAQQPTDTSEITGEIVGVA